MALDLAALPDDVDALRAIVAAQAAELATKDALIDALRLQLARLRRMQFGRSSERLRAEIEQLELALEDLEAEAPGTGATLLPRPRRMALTGRGRPRASPSAAPCPSTCRARSCSILPPRRAQPAAGACAH